MKKTIVAVTGGTGYIASWIVHDLLREGYDVRITVRDQSQVEKYQYLRDIEKKYTGVLSVYEADLLKENSFDEAVNGADIVMHTASPFFLNDKDDPLHNLIEPAVLGTKNLLSSVNKFDSVKRVVLTSSVAAIYGDNRDMTDKGLTALTEADWNDTSDVHKNAYSYSKTQAEKAAWAMMEAQQQWDLVTIHPGFVMGPSLTKRVDSTSIHTLLRILHGEIAIGSPNLAFVFSDVRDVAKAHLLAAFTDKAKGRYIITSEAGTLLKLGQIIDRNFLDAYKVPKRLVPKWLVWLIGPSIGFTRTFVKNNIGYPLDSDTSKSVKELGITYHTLEETVVDHVNQLKKDGLI